MSAPDNIVKSCEEIISKMKPQFETAKDNVTISFELDSDNKVVGDFGIVNFNFVKQKGGIWTGNSVVTTGPYTESIHDIDETNVDGTIYLTVNHRIINGAEYSFLKRIIKLYSFIRMNHHSEATQAGPLDFIKAYHDDLFA